MGRDQGFTILEVVLFFAISAALLGVAMLYTSNSLKSTRYGDATKSFESFIEQQYTEVQAGTVNREAGGGSGSCVSANAPGTSDSCMILGRVLTFNTVAPANKTVNVFTVVANTTPTSEPSGEIDAFAKYNTRIQESTAPTNYSLEWGTTLYSTQYVDGTPQNFNRLAILRSPVSETIYIFTFDHVASFQSGLRADTANKKAAICFTSPDFGSTAASRVASVNFDGRISIDTISSEIKPLSAPRAGAVAC